MLTIIACIGPNRELGITGQLCYHEPADLAFFKATTMGHALLFGRKTFDSVGVLPGRTSYVTSRNLDYLAQLPKEVHPVPDLQAFLTTHAHSKKHIYVCGGATIYQAALPFVSTIILTRVPSPPPVPADVWFPHFDLAEFSLAQSFPLDNRLTVQVYKRPTLA